MLYFETYARIEDQNKEDFANKASDDGTTLSESQEDKTKNVKDGPDNGIINSEIRLNDYSEKSKTASYTMDDMDYTNDMDGMEKNDMGLMNGRGNFDIGDDMGMGMRMAAAKLNTFNKCNNDFVRLQMAKIEGSVSKIQSMLENKSSDEERLRLLTTDDDFFVEIVSALATVNSILDDEEFMECLGESIVEENPESCKNARTIVKGSKRDHVRDVVSRFSFVVPTILLFALKIVKSINKSCTGINKERADALYREARTNIKKMGKFMDIDTLDQQYKRVNKASWKEFKQESNSKEDFSHHKSNCGADCRCGIFNSCICGPNCECRTRKLIVMTVLILILIGACFGLYVTFTK